MAYATKADIEALHGAAFLQTLVAADLDLDTAVATACAAASDEMDSYLAQRFRLPFETAPAILRTWCVDVACWRLAGTAAQMSEEIRKRAERVLAILKDIAGGRAQLPGAPSPSGDAAGEEAAASADGAAFVSRKRRWGGEGGLL